MCFGGVATRPVRVIWSDIGVLLVEWGDGCRRPLVPWSGGRHPRPMLAIRGSASRATAAAGGRRATGFPGKDCDVRGAEHPAVALLVVCRAVPHPDYRSTAAGSGDPPGGTLVPSPPRIVPAHRGMSW